VCSWCAPEPLDYFGGARTGWAERDGVCQMAHQGGITERPPGRPREPLVSASEIRKRPTRSPRTRRGARAAGAASTRTRAARRTARSSCPTMRTGTAVADLTGGGVGQPGEFGGGEAAQVLVLVAGVPLEDFGCCVGREMPGYDRDPLTDHWVRIVCELGHEGRPGRCRSSGAGESAEGGRPHGRRQCRDPGLARGNRRRPPLPALWRLGYVAVGPGPRPALAARRPRPDRRPSRGRPRPSRGHADRGRAGACSVRNRVTAC